MRPPRSRDAGEAAVETAWKKFGVTIRRNVGIGSHGSVGDEWLGAVEGQIDTKCLDSESALDSQCDP
jgi:hypothetical protein